MDEKSPSDHGTAAEAVEPVAVAADTSSPSKMNSAAASNSAPAASSLKRKCQKCDKRFAKEGCTQTACIQCCDDTLGCETHKKQRAQAFWKEQVLAGTTEVQLLAAQKRRMRLQQTAGAGNRRFFFREPGFVYQGDTVVIWDVRAFACNPKWRDDAIRKSLRRKRAELPKNYVDHRRRLGNSRKRFSRIMKDLFEKLCQSDESTKESERIC